jgi:MFS family permease
MTIGWPISATISPRIYLRIGYRATAITGGVFALAGSLVFALFVDADSSLAPVAVAGVILGFGLGFQSVSTVVWIQSTVDWSRRGVVTGSNMFIRTLGSAVGIAVFGSIANAVLADRLRHPPPSLAGDVPETLDAAQLSFTGRHQSAEVVAYVRSSLFDAVHYVFWALVAVAVLGLVAELCLPRREEVRY